MTANPPAPSAATSTTVRIAGNGEPESSPSSMGADAVLSTMRGPLVVVDASGRVVVVEAGCFGRVAVVGGVATDVVGPGALPGVGAVVAVGLRCPVTAGCVGGTVVRRAAVVVVVVVTVAPDGSTPGFA